MSSLKEHIKKPSKFLLSFLFHFYFLFSDQMMIRILYRLSLGRKLNLKNPKRFTEKLQWLKLYYRKAEFTQIVDKITAKQYVAERIGDKYIIPTFGTWKHFDDINFDLLPDKFVLKTNHSSAGNGIIICTDKNEFDKSSARNILEHVLKTNVYNFSREWPYKNIKPMIMAEMLLEDYEVNDIRDYKFYCFNGEPKVMLLASNRFTKHNFDYYDMNFNRLDITSSDGANSEINHTKPECFEEMKEIVSTLCAGFPHIRIDLYYINHKIYFGEMTFFDSSGFDNLSDDTLDLEWGDWITLPNKELCK